jgi:NAD-dependent dihydropyrimidine dehydrogenase PreA subunit
VGGIDMIDKVQRKDCVGCKACGDICPTSAIAFSTDREGFWYPSIDMGKCISCNLCEKVCPAIKPHAASINFFSTPKTYKVYHVDKNVRYNSTSGALYYALAQTFIEKGDYIVGCVYDEGNTGAHHEVSNTMGGLSRIMRSKYL